jgi:hypothetical protein
MLLQISKCLQTHDASLFELVGESTNSPVGYSKRLEQERGISQGEVTA